MLWAARGELHGGMGEEGGGKQGENKRNMLAIRYWKRLVKRNRNTEFPKKLEGRLSEDTKFLASVRTAFPLGAISRFPNCITVSFSEYCRMRACETVKLESSFLCLERKRLLKKFE